MEIRSGANPRDVKLYDTERLRNDFLIQDTFVVDEIKTVYSQIDRIIAGTATPVSKTLLLEAGDELRAKYFLERREMGVINLGGTGTLTLDGQAYTLKYRDGIYVGMGTKVISFKSEDGKTPAKFYFNSAPAHMTYPTVFIDPNKDIKPENKLELGTLEDANHRILRKYILPGQVESCQLEMGITSLEPGSVWNTMPCHTHDRRMEVYLYFEVPENALVFHYMGEPSETRHIIMRNEEAVISPSWSIHSASATHAYSFVWGMVGENQAFDDMDAVQMKDLK
ncbi:5-dehydro-4-deoxy-D-glucuronate isomerase [[Clostridium] fimetarium]|uniref:4-deoxy-L-threo-5-hexosulose-uronate ketol-isomerase n=1 Tax=[Clostridium] fimetarium TaxID=99656 RepID=A0A1I0Q205_9FIRM|nr:5-dehydro-4-deoxy-D-glucuronate isomerase [[Clostridium] fimetarium]SEW20811.1 4-deoxy-L-threo-5-hexosulose-uronate ketol-isomerase [[Clostridium] fimetarium]